MDSVSIQIHYTQFELKLFRIKIQYHCKVDDEINSIANEMNNTIKKINELNCRVRAPPLKFFCLQSLIMTTYKDK